VLSLDFLRAFNIDCSFELAYFEKYLLVMSMPVLLVAFICVIGRFFKRTLGEMTGSISLVLFLLYPSISAKTFEMFECRDFGDGTVLHKRDYSLDCNSASFAGYKAFAWVVIFIYPIGIPGIFVLLFFKQRSKLNISVNEDGVEYKHGDGEWQPVDSDEDKLNDALKTQHHFEFLVGSYVPRYFFWEIVEYLRKFILTGALIFVQQESSSQIYVGMLVSFFFFALVTTFQPYKEVSLDWLKMISEAQIFVTLLSSMMLLTADLNNEAIDSDSIDDILVFVNVVAVPLVLVLTVIAQWTKKTRKDGEATLRASLATRYTRVEIEMGEVSNPIADNTNKKKTSDSE